jgi:AAA domain/Winged helix-turn-helix DNA-binding
MNARLSLSALAAITELRREQELRNTTPRRERLGRNESEPMPAAFVPAYKKGLRVLNGEELLKTDLPRRSLMLAPWLPEKGLAMIFAPRGVGKTWLALSIAHAVASGGEFLRWRATRPQRVLYIDGEMPAETMQARYAAVVAASMTDAPSENFQLLAADLQNDGLPDLADSDAQRHYSASLVGVDLIVVDNLSAIARSLRENEADSWGPVQSWLLAQRAAGRSVIIVHHAGKGGSQRGTSRKEDVLDSVISLTLPPGHAASDGARFEISFTKSRNFFGVAAEPFEARLSDGRWDTFEIAVENSDSALIALHEDGLSVRDIARRTGMSSSTVGRRLKARP